MNICGRPLNDEPNNQPIHVRCEKKPREADREADPTWATVMYLTNRYAPLVNLIHFLRKHQLKVTVTSRWVSITHLDLNESNMCSTCVKLHREVLSVEDEATAHLLIDVNEAFP